MPEARRSEAYKRVAYAPGACARPFNFTVRSQWSRKVGDPLRAMDLIAMSAILARCLQSRGQAPFVAAPVPKRFKVFPFPLLLGSLSRIA